MLLMVAVGTLMVSTIRFPSSKQPKSKATFIALGVCVLLLALLQTRFFALFFVFYISATLLLNIAWQGGWTRIAPPKVYEDEAVG
jgi:CDP-diacylglycerol--serine O-phosphatidyltransferase